MIKYLLVVLLVGVVVASVVLKGTIERYNHMVEVTSYDPLAK